MNEEITNQVIELGTNIEHTPLEYIYITIPAEYICVYHRILAMLADYGEEMLKDCKATCKDRNSGVIECFNMFNAAVAARKLGKDSLAEVLIKYIKAKINQIYKGKDNSTSFVFPVDENGQLKAFVSCGERPKFWINPDDGELYEHKFANGFDEHFRLGDEDIPGISNDAADTILYTPNSQNVASPLTITIIPRWEKQGTYDVACADVMVWFRGNKIDLNNTDYQYYFDDTPVIRFNDIQTISPGTHTFTCVVNYKGYTNIESVVLNYEGS